MNSASPALRLEEVSFRYGKIEALDNVSLQLERGRFMALIGPNGGGKSTLVRLILGLLEPMSGTVEVLGGSPRQTARRIGYVPQFARLARELPISAHEVVLQGRLGRRAWWLPMNRADHRAAQAALVDAGVGNLSERPIMSLSGGQLQRVLLARALATEPELLLLDEPTAHVDCVAEQNLFESLAGLRDRMSIIVVSHDIGLVSRYVDSVACLNRRLVCHDAVPLEAGVLEQVYGMPMRLVDHLHQVPA